MKPNKKLTKVESTHRVQTSVNAGNVEKWHILPFCKNGKNILYPESGIRIRKQEPDQSQNLITSSMAKDYVPFHISPFIVQIHQ